MKTQVLKIRCFVSDPHTHIGFYDDFDLDLFDNDINSFMVWYLGVLDVVKLSLDYFEVI